MKSNEELDSSRFYEITEVDKGDTWYGTPGSGNSIVGAIVRPVAEDPGRYTVIKSSPDGFLDCSVNESLFFGRDGCITLRPLNKRDQRKIQRLRDQFCD